MRTESLRIPCGTESLAACVDWAEGSPPPSVLSLHGGGPSHKDTTRYLAEALTRLGKTVVRFDFSGQGESTGEMSRSSLAKRIDEASAAWRFLGSRTPVTLVGTSMGGYVAASLVPETNVDTLILFCPAAYAARARNLEFGSGFTDVIRQARSFLETDIGESLTGFTGRTLFIRGTKDEVIPEAVVELYRQALAQTNRWEEWAIEGCPHSIHRWAASRPSVQDAIVDRVVRFLASPL